MAVMLLRRVILVIAIALCGGIFADGGLSPLHQAAENGDVAEVKRLIDGGADVNTKSKKGWTPLHRAAIGGQTEIALALIKAGADIGTKDNDGFTPLHYAAWKNQAETAFALVKAGANIGAKDNDGLTPLHLAAVTGKTETALALIKAGADIEAKAKGFTPLHLAVWKGQIETAIALIKAGADIDAKDNNGGATPLHIASEAGQAEIALALIHSGAYLRATANNGETPLDSARRFKQWGVVKILENPPPPKPSGEQAPNVATAPAPEDSTIAEHVFENAWRSVVYIENNKGQGSGVIIKRNIVATNCHVIDGGGIVVYKAHNRRTDKSKKYRATIRRRDEKNDFCLLDVKGLFGVAADVRRYDSLRVGENVYGIGAPKGLDLSLSTGVISQTRAADGVRYIQTDVAISPGSSGGGLFDRKGNLVGILTSKLVDDDVEGIGFAIPADLALE
ncbi:MAG: ankyrin repeat domain-containing protein [Gammaproteobacteria bacterium]